VKTKTLARTSASIGVILTLTVGCLFAAAAAKAPAKEAPAEAPKPAIELGAPFADNAILQRQMPVPVWGWDKPGSQITVEFAGQKKTAAAGADGKWMAKLDALEASAEPREMTISDAAGNKVVLKNILVGEVWMASGQSNMQWEAGKSSASVIINKLADEAAAKNAKLPPIREGTLTNVASSLFPIEHAEGKWSDGSNYAEYSAIAFAFAAELYQELHIPIGILNCSFSTTQIEAWTPREGFAEGSDPYAKSEYRRILEADPRAPEYKAAWDKFYQDIEDTVKANAQLVKEGKPARAISTKTPGNLNGNRDACWMYNAKINPVVPYAIRGAIWNQGYANSGAGMTYYSNLHSLIRGWRKVWQQGDFPVYFHQFYCPKGSDGLSLNSTAEMRLGTCLARDIPNADMASQIDISGAVHYYNKAVPGQRLARLALKNQYGKKIVADGPIFKSYKVDGDKLIVEFDFADGGLVVGQTTMGKGLAVPAVIENGQDKVTLFYIADKDRVWHRAKVKIDGEKVVLTAPGVSEPRGVAYGCEGVGTLPNLYNHAMLPMTPFIYYDHKLVTSETWPDDPIKVAGVTPDPTAGGLRYEYRKMPLLSAQFRDNAVLQAGQPVVIWGSAIHDWGYEAKGKAEIKFSFAGFEKTIPVTPGMREWRVTLPPMEATAKPQTLKAVFTIDGEVAHESVCENVVIGDVWYVSAPLGQGQGSKSDGPVRVMTRRAKRSTHSRPSRFSVCVSTTPENRFASEWQNADSGFAAALGNRIHAKTGKPVGIILMGDSGLQLKQWIGYACLKNAPSLADDYKQLAAIDPGSDEYAASAQAYIAAWKKYWGESVPELIATKRTMNGAAWGSYPSFASSITTDASEAFNVMVDCFGPGNFKGIVFLPDAAMCEKDQGANYGEQLSALANCWKGWFACPDPYFFYAIPGKSLAAKVTSPAGIKGKSTAYEIDQWLTSGASAKAAKKGAAGGADKQLAALIDKIIDEAYK